jgi:hypothetical protein
MSFKVLLGAVSVVIPLDTDPHTDYEAVIRTKLKIRQLFPILVKPLNQPAAHWITAKWFAFQRGQTYVLKSFDRFT